MPLLHRTFISLQSTAPPPYRTVIIVNPKSVKNSIGGEEPDNNSPIAGERKNKINGGERRGLCCFNFN